MVNSMELEAAPSEVAADESGKALSPQDDRYAREVARQLNELVNSLAGLEGLGVARLRAELNTRAGGVEEAVRRGDSGAVVLANEAALFVTAYYAKIQSEAKESREKDAKEVEKELLAPVAHALEVKQTEYFMERNGIEMFKDLREPAKRFAVENTQRMIAEDPFYREAYNIHLALGDDSIMVEQKKKAEEAYKDLMALAEKTGNEKLKEQLLHMKERLGKEENLAELIDVNKAVQEKIEGGESQSKAAESAVEALRSKVTHCDKANDTIQAKAYERLSDGMKDVLSERSGGKPTPEQLRKLVKEFKESGKLTAENISDAVERLEGLRKEGKEFSDLSEDDQLLLSVAQQHFNVETGKTLFGMAKHLVRLKEKEPEKYEQLMDKYKTAVSHHDVEGLTTLMEESGFQLADGATPEGRMVYHAIANMSPEQAERVVNLAGRASNGDEAAMKELKQLFRDEVQVAINNHYNSDEAAEGRSMGDNVCRAMDFGDSRQRLLFDLALLKETYRAPDSLQEYPSQGKKGFYDALVVSAGDFLGWNNAAQSNHIQVASLEGEVVPSDTPVSAQKPLSGKGNVIT